jgi:hypothetical protein
MRWPWRRCRDEEHPGNGHAAAKAKEEAAEALKAVEERWPEVHHASNIFADQVEDAFRRRRRHT